MNKEKWLGIDYGKSRIGVAISDDLLFFAHALETIPSTPREVALHRLANLIVERAVTGLVVGLPKKTNSASSEMEFEVEIFVQELLSLLAASSYKVRVEWFDERFTTVLAKRYLQANGVKEKKQRSVVDQVAASIILQNFLDQKKRLF